MHESYDFTILLMGEGIQQNEGFDSSQEKVSHNMFVFLDHLTLFLITLVSQQGQN